MEFNDQEWLKKREEFMKKSAEEAVHGSRDFIFKKKVSLFTAKEGNNVVRILPPMWKGALHYGIDVYIHYGVGANNSQFLCLEMMKKGPCPICQDFREAQKKGDKDTQDASKYNHRVVCYVINRTAPNEGPLIWNMPYGTVYKPLIIKANKKTGGFYMFDDPKDGRDIEFTTTGKGKATKYPSVGPSLENSALSDDPDQVEKWLKFVADDPLPDLLDYKPYEYIKQVWSGEDILETPLEPDAKLDTHKEVKVSDKPLTSEATAKEMKKEKEEVKPPEKPVEATTPKSGNIKTKLRAMNMQQLEEFMVASSIDLKASDYTTEELVQAIMLEMGID